MSTNGTTGIWYETPAGRELNQKLSDEHTVGQLNKLLDRIDVLEQAVERLTGLLEKGPGVAAMIADMVDEGFRRAQTQHIDLDERFQLALDLAEKLTQPERVKKLYALLELSDQVPGIMAMTVDVLDESYRKAMAQGLDLGTLFTQSVAVLKQLSTVLNSQEFASLMNSSILSPATLNVISKAGTALVECGPEQCEQVGIFGLVRGLGDPDRKKAIGFLMNFAKRFGQKLS